MYLTEPPNKLVALDPPHRTRILGVRARAADADLSVLRPASTAGRPSWARLSTGARSMRNSSRSMPRRGNMVWQTTVVEDYEKGYALTVAPLIINGKVIVGTAGGEFGIRGYLAAYDAETGEEEWRFYTIPGPRRTRTRDLGERRLEDRGRLDLAYGILRPGPEPHLLGRRKPRARLEPGRAAGRQPLHGLRNRSRSGHWKAALALPVHSRTTNGTGTRCRSRSWSTWTGRAVRAS